jgi:hypothetical protein
MVPVATGTGWQSFSVPLVEGDWEYTDDLVGTRTATQADMKSVLAVANNVRYRADIFGGSGETQRLDNIRLTDGPVASTPPPPPSGGPTGQRAAALKKCAKIKKNKAKKKKCKKKASRTAGLVSRWL